MKGNSAIFEMSNLKDSLRERTKAIQSLFDEFGSANDQEKVVKFLVLLNKKKEIHELSPDALWNGIQKVPKKPTSDLHVHPVS